MVVGDYVLFDFFVIVIGIMYDGLSMKVECVQGYEVKLKKVWVVNFVFIVGGGFVGVEFVGEIVIDFFEKKVIMSILNFKF